MPQSQACAANSHAPHRHRRVLQRTALPLARVQPLPPARHRWQPATLIESPSRPPRTAPCPKASPAGAPAAHTVRTALRFEPRPDPPATTTATAWSSTSRPSNREIRSRPDHVSADDSLPANWHRRTLTKCAPRSHAAIQARRPSPPSDVLDSGAMVEYNTESRRRAGVSPQAGGPTVAPKQLAGDRRA